MLPGNFLKVGIVADDKTKKGITSAQKNINGLNKSVKNLGKTFASVFAAQKVIAFGRSSVNAFMEAEKANTRLAGAVKNLGLSFAQAEIQQNLDKISRSSGIAGEVLVDALQPLLTTTGSVIQSQKLLQQALDISAGSGIDLATVSQDLANAYVGNTKGLKKYNLGLTQAELKTISFTEVQARFNKQFQGSNAAYLATYAGKMQILEEAAGNASETIGGALIDSVMLLSGSSGIEDLITKIDKLADRTVGFIDKFSEGLATLNAIRNSSLGDMSKNIQDVQVAAYNARLRRTYMDAWKGVDIPKSPKQLAAEKKAEADAAKRARDIANATKKNTAELKKQAALKKAGTIFDMDQIQIIAALKGKISEEDRKRLELQFALLLGNEDEAKRLTYELAIAQGLGVKIAKDLASLPQAANPFASWEAYLDMIADKARKIASITVNAPLGTAAAAAAAGTAVSTNVSTNVPVTGFTPPPSGTYGTPTGAVQGPQVIELKITGDGDLTNTIAKNLMQQSLSSGNQTYVNRRTGGFE